ncbi:MAG: hypothetical protein PUJ82_03040 [Spirochaetales bacterium]|nr:hypothetical protein [Spirochaetales bacterium]
MRYRFIPSLRFGTGYASPYNPCHGLKSKNSKLNLIVLVNTLLIFLYKKEQKYINTKFYI